MSIPTVAPEKRRLFYEQTCFIMPYGSAQRALVFEWGARDIMRYQRAAHGDPRQVRALALAKLPEGIYISKYRRSNIRRVAQLRLTTHACPFLSGDVVFDFDGEDSREQLLYARRLGLERYGCPSWSVFTGSRWHLWFFVSFSGTAAGSAERLVQYSRFLQKEANYFIGAGVKFCMRPFLNAAAVFRLPGGYHRGTGAPVSLDNTLTNYATRAGFQPGSMMEGVTGRASPGGDVEEAAQRSDPAVIAVSAPSPGETEASL